MPVPDGWFDTVTFNRNRERFPEEELRKYWGRHVAWSLDGTHILADGETFEELHRRIEEQGISPSEVAFSFVPDPDTSYI